MPEQVAAGLATYVKQRRLPGWKRPDGAVSCVRGKGANPGRWGIVFRPGDAAPDGGVVRDHDHAVELYAVWLRDRFDVQELARQELAGRVLMCWCAPGRPCHVQDVLLPLVNEGRVP